MTPAQQARQASLWRRVWREDALVRQDNRCCWCQRRLEREEATAEHLKARSRGGRDEAGNIGAAHRECNMARGSIGPQVFTPILKGIEPIPMEFDSERRWAIYLMGVSYRFNRRVDLACKRILAVARG